MTDTPDWMQPTGSPWRRANARRMFENAWIALHAYDAIAPTGKPADYGVVHFKNRAIGVLPIFEDGSVVLVGQHRFTFQAYSWEIPEAAPAGGGSGYGRAAELREETGIEAASLTQVLSFDLSNSVTDEHGFGYIATGLTFVEARPDDTEDLSVVRVPFREALDLAIKGAITDMITVAMLLRAYHMAQEDELPAALAQAMLHPDTVGRATSR